MLSEGLSPGYSIIFVLNHNLNRYTDNIFVDLASSAVAFGLRLLNVEPSQFQFDFTTIHTFPLFTSSFYIVI